MITFESALAQIKRRYPNLDDDEAREFTHEWLAERAEHLQAHEDTPCLESGVDNCDDAGTGEGQFHGRIG